MSYRFPLADSKLVYPHDESYGERLSSSDALSFLDRVIWGGLLLLLPLAAIPHGAVEQWWEAAIECYLFALGSLWIVNGLFSGRWTVMHWSLLLPLLTLAGYAVLQTVPIRQTVGSTIIGNGRWQPISADLTSTRHFIFQLLALIIFGQLLLGYLTLRRQLWWLIRTIIGVGVGSAIFGLLRLIAQRAVPDLLIFDLSSAVGYGQFLNPNHFALMIEMALGLELGLVLGGVRRPHLFLHLGIIFVLATSIVLTNSRGGVFSLLCLIVFLALIFVIRRNRRSPSAIADEAGPSRRRVIGQWIFSLLLVCSLVLIVVVGIVKLGGEPLSGRMDKLSAEWGNNPENRTNTQRGDIWRATWQLIRANRLFGVGFGAYQTAIPAFHDASGVDIPSTAINDYLNLMASGGLIGCGIVVWLALMIALRIREQLKTRDAFRRAAIFGAVAGLFSVAVHSLFDFGLHTPVNALIFSALIVLATADVRSRAVRNRLSSPAPARVAD